jgi:hypothetical protein
MFLLYLRYRFVEGLNALNYLTAEVARLERRPG